MGCSFRVKGCRIKCNSSSVSQPKIASSPISPNITGVSRLPWGSAMWHSDSFRSTIVPSARTHLTESIDFNPMARQTLLGNSV